jgi:hypothetical protein
MMMMRRKKNAPPEAQLMFVLEDGEPVLYCEVKGKRIAKRYSQQHWISLEPGYSVSGTEPGGDPKSIYIAYDPNAAKVQ